MPKRETIADRVMNEVTVYGGLPMRRCDVFTLATEHMGEYAAPPFGADYFAFAGPAVALDPWPIAKAREIMR